MRYKDESKGRPMKPGKARRYPVKSSDGKKWLYINGKDLDLYREGEGFPLVHICIPVKTLLLAMKRRGII